MTKSKRSSADIWRRFQEQVADLGGILVEPEYLGSAKPHRVICTAGHEHSTRPINLHRGDGLCRVTAPAMVGYHQSRAASVWQRFRERVSDLGGTVIESAYLGSQSPHRVVCAAGHKRSVIPNNILMGAGICRICAGLDPADSEQRFRDRVEELGGRVIEPRWLGVHRPHRVICAAGHECSPYPGRVRGGGGLCLACRRALCNAFYVVESESIAAIKIGITTGTGTVRLREHHRDGFTAVLRYLQELDDAAFLEAHTLKTLKTAGIKPIRGLEYFERASALPVVLDIVDNWI